MENRRAESNKIFREHRLEEVKVEANAIVEIVFSRFLLSILHF